MNLHSIKNVIIFILLISNIMLLYLYNNEKNKHPEIIILPPEIIVEYETATIDSIYIKKLESDVIILTNVLNNKDLLLKKQELELKYITNKVGEWIKIFKIYNKNTVDVLPRTENYYANSDSVYVNFEPILFINTSIFVDSLLTDLYIEYNNSFAIQNMNIVYPKTTIINNSITQYNTNKTIQLYLNISSGYMSNQQIINNQIYNNNIILGPMIGMTLIDNKKSNMMYTVSVGKDIYYFGIGFKVFSF